VPARRMTLSLAVVTAPSSRVAAVTTLIVGYRRPAARCHRAATRTENRFVSMARIESMTDRDQPDASGRIESDLGLGYRSRTQRPSRAATQMRSGTSKA
jgi:hypothetical protein